MPRIVETMRDAGWEIRNAYGFLIHGKIGHDMRYHTVQERIRILRGKEPIADVRYRIVSRLWGINIDFREVGLIPEENTRAWIEHTFRHAFGDAQSEDITNLHELFTSAVEGDIKGAEARIRSFEALQARAEQIHRNRPNKLDALDDLSLVLFEHTQNVLLARYKQLHNHGQLPSELASRIPLMQLLGATSRGVKIVISNE